VQVIARQGVQGRGQLAHDTSIGLEHVFEVYREKERGRKPKGQVTRMIRS
jgi:hypothetical protein